MRSDLRVLKFFGLTWQEKRILEQLPKTGAVSISELSRRTKLSRTTARENLYRLHERGMARKVRIHGALQWKCPSSAALERYIAAGAQMLGAFTDKKQRTVKVRHAIHAADSVEVQVVHGALNIIHIHLREFACKKGERLLLTQYASGFAAQRKKIPSHFMKKANEIGAKHGGILEMIMTEKTKREYAKLAHADASWAPNASQRLVDIGILPDEWFPNQTSELFIFRNTVMLTDWHNETAVLVENEELAGMLRNFFRLAKNQADTFNNHEFLTMLIEQFSAEAKTAASASD
jgi:hypothetical protein